MRLVPATLLQRLLRRSEISKTHYLAGKCMVTWHHLLNNSHKNITYSSESPQVSCRHSRWNVPSSWWNRKTKSSALKGHRWGVFSILVQSIFVYRKGNHATYCISSWSSIWMFRIGNLHIVSYRKLLDTKSHVNKICQNIAKKCFPYMLFMYLSLCSNEVHIESIYVFTLI